MCDKSNVSIEQKICPVCGEVYGTGTILLDRRFRDKLKRHTITGTDFCPEHQKLKDDGYVAAIECDESRSNVQNDQAHLGDVYRLGRIAHIKKEVCGQLFGRQLKGDIVFVDTKTMDALTNIKNKNEEN